MCSIKQLFVCVSPIFGIILSVLLLDRTAVKKLLGSSLSSLDTIVSSDKACAGDDKYMRPRFEVKRYQQLSLQQFYDEYDGQWPVIVTDVVSPSQVAKWSASYLLRAYGAEKVVLKRVKGELDSAYSYAVQLKSLYRELQSAQPDNWAYVEDELFISTRPELTSSVPTTVYCEENFFALFPEEVRPWGSMLLWGSKYSRSSLHIDPYNWTGTNLVLWGHKHWKMYPPGNDHLLYVAGNQQAGFPLPTYKYNSPIDASSPDYKRYPLFREAEAVEFDQYAGDMLFIPSGWFHQAYNVEETLAISGQLMNTNNWHIVLEEILKASPGLRLQLPEDMGKRTPVEQVQTVMGLIPADVLERGRQLTANILKQIHSE